MRMILIAILCAATACGAAERYSAQDTLRRAGVGTFSPRPDAAPSVGRSSGDYERMHCYVNPARRLPATVTCERRK